MGFSLKRGINDLQTVRPDLAGEWHPFRNRDLTPSDICVYSSRRVWWQTTAVRRGKVFVLEWESTVANRAMGSGCPYLSVPPKRLLKGFNDFASTAPEAAALWHETKNGAIGPDMIFRSTAKKYWWQHTVKRNQKLYLHEWQASPKAVHPDSCPVCRGTKVMKGFNDLATLHPALAAQWDTAANKGLLPDQFTAGSNQKVFWHCDACGNRWKASINNRSRGNGCPRCAWRYSTSFPEQALYFYLKTHFPGCKNRDVTALGNMELDIYLPENRIAVEYNGLWAHRTERKRQTDQKKLRECGRNGILLIRICESDEMRHIPGEHLIYCREEPQYRHLPFVMDCLCKELMAAGCLDVPIPIDIDRDRQQIFARYFQSVKERSLAENFPGLLKEWDYEKNGGLSPSHLFAYSNIKVHWTHTVQKGNEAFLHSWTSPVSHRTFRGDGCPYCAGKRVMPGFNDLRSAAPAFLGEWDTEKNAPLTPEKITCKSRQKVWWLHTVLLEGEEITHSWAASPQSRSRGSGCLICAGKIIRPGINDLASTHPALLKEWDWQRNTISPREVSYGCDKKVWWTHTVTSASKSFTHCWQASPNSRTNRRSGCPYCANKKALPGYNDLASAFPALALKWDPAKNAPLSPEQVTWASAKRVWWTDRETPVRISDRTKYMRRRTAGIR